MDYTQLSTFKKNKKVFVLNFMAKCSDRIIKGSIHAKIHHLYTKYYSMYVIHVIIMCKSLPSHIHVDFLKKNLALCYSNRAGDRIWGQGLCVSSWLVLFFFKLSNQYLTRVHLFKNPVPNSVCVAYLIFFIINMSQFS